MDERPYSYVGQSFGRREEEARSHTNARCPWYQHEVETSWFRVGAATDALLSDAPPRVLPSAVNATQVTTPSATTSVPLSPMACLQHESRFR